MQTLTQCSIVRAFIEFTRSTSLIFAGQERSSPSVERCLPSDVQVDDSSYQPFRETQKSAWRALKFPWSERGMADLAPLADFGLSIHLIAFGELIYICCSMLPPT